ncbi:MAG TPA: hypothetical protein DDZ66_01580, partial [Firmicutes bacterium]|nr:hypothetical protein [Bacillota bacterium]
MKKIRVKNKYLVMVVVSALVAMGAVHLGGGSYLWVQARRASSNGDHVKALAYYDALIERYPNHSRIPDALYWSAELLPSFDTFAATFFPLRSGVTVINGGIPEPHAGALSRVERYLRIREKYPHHWAAAHVDYKLAESYHILGDPRSEEFYFQALRNERATGRLNAAMRLVQIYEARNLLDEALAVIEYCQLHLPNHSAIEVEIKLGDVLALRGDYDGARNAYERVLMMAKESEEEFRAQPLHDSSTGEPLEISIVPYYQEQIKTKLANLGVQESGEPVLVQGRVTALGEPLSGINVYANQIIDGSRSYFTDQPGRWVTSEDGTFVGTLPQATFEFGIGLNYHQAQLVEGTHLQILHGELDLTAQDKSPLIEFRFVEPVRLLQPEPNFIYAGESFEISWDAYPGAHEYGVSVSGVIINAEGGTSYVSARSEITKQRRMVFDKRTVTGFGVVRYDSRGIDPAYLVGRPEVYDRLRIVVKALDEEGNTLSSSGGLHFGADTTIPGDVVVQGGQRSQWEQLLLERRYDEAVGLLEAKVEANPEDVDALWILARIYFSGTHALGEDPWDTRTFAYRDLEKSIETLNRIW